MKRIKLDLGAATDLGEDQYSRAIYGLFRPDQYYSIGRFYRLQNEINLEIPELDTVVGNLFLFEYVINAHF